MAQSRPAAIFTSLTRVNTHSPPRRRPSPPSGRRRVRTPVDMRQPCRRRRRHTAGRGGRQPARAGNEQRPTADKSSRHAGLAAGGVLRQHACTQQTARQLTNCTKLHYSPTVHTHTHTHTFNGPLSGTTRVSRYQKGKTNLDSTEARDSEWQWHQLGHMQVCTSVQTDNHASTPPLSFFYRPDALPAAQPTASKH